MMQHWAQGFEYLTLAFMMVMLLSEKTRTVFINIITYNAFTTYAFFYLILLMIAASAGERIWRLTRKH